MDEAIERIASVVPAIVGESTPGSSGESWDGVKEGRNARNQKFDKGVDVYCFRRIGVIGVTGQNHSGFSPHVAGTWRYA